MKYLGFIFIFLLGCSSEVTQSEGDRSCTIQNDMIVCPDGTQININNEPTKVILPVGSCTQVVSNVWAEHIWDNGTKTYVFDVYSNSSCSDALGEYCDNVVPSDDSTGSVEPYKGSGTVCFADEINMVFGGNMLGNSDIKVWVWEF